MDSLSLCLEVCMYLHTCIHDIHRHTVHTHAYSHIHTYMHAFVYIQQRQSQGNIQQLHVCICRYRQSCSCRAAGEKWCERSRKGCTQLPQRSRGRAGAKELWSSGFWAHLQPACSTCSIADIYCLACCHSSPAWVESATGRVATKFKFVWHCSPSKLTHSRPLEATPKRASAMGFVGYFRLNSSTLIIPCWMPGFGVATGTGSTCPL